MATRAHVVPSALSERTRFCAITMHAAKLRREMHRARRGPSLACVHRDLGRIRGFESVDIYEIAVLAIHEFEVCTPVGGNNGNAARHRLHERPTPPFTSRGQHERTRHVVQRRQIATSDARTEYLNRCNIGAGAPATRLAQKRIDSPVDDIGVPIGVDLADRISPQHERDVIVRAKGIGPCAQ